MKLENKKQKVLPLRAFALRLLHYAQLALLVIIISLAIGVLGYKYFGGLTWIDSFYMTSMILTGMGPVVELTTNSAKLFSSFYALYSGVVFLSIMAVFLAPLIHRVLHILHVEDSEDEEN